MEGRLVDKPFVRWFEDEIWPTKVNQQITNKTNSEDAVRNQLVAMDNKRAIIPFRLGEEKNTQNDEITVTGTETQEKRKPEIVTTLKEQPYCRVLQFTDHNGQKKEMIFPKGLDLDRPKRERTSFSAFQLRRLEEEFAKTQYMVGKDRCVLAMKLNLSETQVKVWFQNRRTKFKRERTKIVEMHQVNAESIAARNILHIIDSSRPPIPTNPFY